MDFKRKIQYFKSCSTIQSYYNFSKIHEEDFMEYYFCMNEYYLSYACPRLYLCDDRIFFLINGACLSHRKDLTIKIIDHYKHILNWGTVSRNFKLNVQFVKKYFNYIDFDELSKNRNLSYEIASDRKIRRKLNSNNFDYKTLDENVASLFINEINLKNYLFHKKTISSDFLSRYCSHMVK